MQSLRSAWVFGSLSIAVAGCRMPQALESAGFYLESEEPLARDQAGASVEAEAAPPLLAWDGGVVQGPRPGQVSDQGTPAHGLEPTIEGRMHILELYQAVLDERDSLALEVKALTAALEKSETGLGETRRASSELETRMAALEEAKEALLRQNQELAARLTTAQIRRLEAEKLLLETRIAWQREKGEPQAPRGEK